MLFHFIVRFPLAVFHLNLTTQRYVDKVLTPVGLPFMSHHARLTFQQYNACSPIEHVTTACISACQTLPWPARSTDLSPIEHVWSIMARALQSTCDIDDLTRELDRIWFDIPQENIRNLYQLMPSRIIACIRARGEQIPY